MRTSAHREWTARETGEFRCAKPREWYVDSFGKLQQAIHGTFSNVWIVVIEERREA